MTEGYKDGFLLGFKVGLLGKSDGVREGDVGKSDDGVDEGMMDGFQVGTYDGFIVGSVVGVGV